MIQTAGGKSCDKEEGILPEQPMQEVSRCSDQFAAARRGEPHGDEI